MQNLKDKIIEILTGRTAKQRAYSKALMRECLDNYDPNGINPLERFYDEVDEEKAGH